MTTTKARRRQITGGNGGWVRVDEYTPLSGGDRGDPEETFVRVTLADGRFRIAEIYFAPPFRAQRLRTFPTAWVESVMNGLAPDEREDFVASMSHPGPLLHTAASWFRQRPGLPSEGAWVNWATRMLVSQRADLPEGPDKEYRAPHLDPVYRVYEVPKVSLKLKVPREGTRPYPDEFFEQVAAVYSFLAQQYRDPAPRIADVNHVEVTKVHRWVKRARALGFLPPAQQGKRG